MSEEVNKSVGNDSIGVSAEAHVGTEVTDSSVSAGVGASAEGQIDVFLIPSLVREVDIPTPLACRCMY